MTTTKRQKGAWKRIGDVLSMVVPMALAGGAVLAYRMRAAEGPAASALAPAPVIDTRALAAEGHWIGQPDAKLVIVEFSDFQCPFCAQAARELREFRARHPDEVSVSFRHLPLQDIHPHAFSAARASACAAAQNRFEAYHDQLFQDQASIGRTPWMVFAQAAGVPDVHAFQACMAGDQTREVVERDLRAAKALKLSGTPVLIVNGEVHPGAPGPAVLESWLATARK